NAALGILVLGNQVIVSSSPNVFVFTDTDGDDQPDTKEILFTGIGGIQDDHGVHAFVFGPDGKLYFNVGNAGRQIMDRHGAPIVDLAGNEVAGAGHPYRQGMVFRANRDGSAFEVLGHNFRNSYEVAVDAYGTLWQSDNDDDGNRGVRINYVMEFGNYGYQDELTGAHWRARRTGMHPEIPQRHWHLNDPGVVPNLLQTGAGSPTGIAVYEGSLLPEIFRDQIIHADAGPNVVRAYPVTDDGAGYQAEIVDILKSERDQWFRPSDVAVAPDGSLLIADWYDATVGGNQAVDQERGRLFRVAPPGTPYRMPAQDLSTPAGAVEALKSPNIATRSLAWLALHEWGVEAEPALQTLWQADHPRHRARALWLLGRIEGRGAHYVEKALQEADSNLRIVGLRLARQRGLDVIPYVEQVARDPSPQVRREAALALRHHQAPEAAGLWATLATQHDGNDRWYLEALGIGADRQWERYFAAWLERVGKGWKTPAGRDIVWRARASAALPMLADLIIDPATDPAQRNRYFRAFDFHQNPAKHDLLATFIDGQHPDQAEILVLALKHLADPDAPRTAAVDAALAKALDAVEGTQAFLDLVDRFAVDDSNETLRRMAFAMPDSSFAPEAARLLLRFGGSDLVREAIDHGDAATALRQLGRVDSPPARALLEDVLADSSYPLTLRRQAVEALGRTWGGEDRLLALVK
ncbi:MAG: PVC-type heme-binding CxxCH protein, partial [Rhodothermales bacterium]